MALGNSAGVLFKISADNSDAKRAFNETERDVKGLGGAMGAMGGPAGIASTAIAAVGAAALAAVVGIARLTVATSELGSQLFDAQAQTGLTASQLSALKLAADTSGSSLDSISNSVAKFNVLVGQAAGGNEKAEAILKKYGITATDSGEALEQAFEAVYNATNKNTAAAELFKDKTGQTIPVIDAMSGSLKEAEEAAKKLGLTLTEEDIKAADAFGDTLDILTKQAQAAGQQFALEFMPNVTSAMQAISGSMENNQSVAREWGRSLGDSIRGVEVYFQGLNAGVQAAMAGINRAFGTNLQATINWANTVLAVVSPLFAIFQMIGAGNPLDLKGGIGGKFGGGAVMPSIPSGGGGKGGGGGATGPDPAVEAEKQRKAAVDAAERTMRDTLDIYKAGYQEREAALNASLGRGEILEIEHIRDIARLRLEAVMDEKRLNEQLLANENITLNEQERAEILQKIKILTIEIRVEKLKGGTAINAQVQKEIADAEKLLEIERDRLETERKRRAEREKRTANSLLDEKKAELDRKERNRNAIQGIGTGGTDQFGQLAGMFKDNPAMVAGIEAAKMAFEGLAQAIGSVVQAWVLYGSAGQSVRQVTAQILAGIAQQAAVKAVFELAEGFAALARAFFGDPKASAEAAMHFKSAAIYGTVAAIAGVAGRGVAGNSFNQAAGGATGSGGGGGGQQQNNFTTKFQGFGSGLNDQFQKQNMVLAQLEETQHQLARKITGMSPGDVVAIAADENPGAFRTGYESTLSDDARATDGLMRRIGAAR